MGDRGPTDAVTGEKHSREPRSAGSGPSAWDAALRLLGARARSRQEMHDRLVSRGFTEDEVSTTMSRLDECDLLDDAEFAHEWVQSRHAHSARGRHALRRELGAKGIDDEIVADALETIDPEAERDIAYALAEKKLTFDADDLADPNIRAKAFRRLSGALGRRGYPPDVITSVVKDVITARRE
ncbi:regulatory protein RecX [Gordonia liuliyuniae]|uniref:Regulatory protein RecX n=1 Tax=Gordonia liuliyuniae TaxID=2911517 RepID=A0ABS9IRF6_9ACTN|nr:regulatory protein RecX [Gordonia liuliyuniae]MCF8588138.1 recombination regulator RecX [Gordonia liuliyuniae]